MKRLSIFPARQWGGFSLMELLTVMAILSILIALALPSLTSLSQANALSHAGQVFVDSLSLGLDEALTGNQKVTIRLIKLPNAVGGALHYRAFQTWVVNAAGTTTPLTQVNMFPNGVVISESPNLSPLLQSPPAQTGTMAVTGFPRDYASFTITATGALDSTITSANSVLTLVQEKDVTSPSPANFFSIFINPATGNASAYRP